MTGNPLSGHTKKNMTLTTHTSLSTPTIEDGLFDGEPIISPSITNAYEGIHGNGIILEEDTAKGDGDRNNPINLAGRVNGVASSSHFRVNVLGGYAVIDGVMFAFAGSNTDIDLISTSAHKAGSPSALTSGQEALVVIYVNSDNDNNSIGWEMGSPVTAGTSYPLAPSSFLNYPLSSLAVKQSIVLATLRCVYESGSGDLNIKVTEINDKRVFIRPSPIYLSPVTSGAVAATDAIESHTALDSLHGADETGAMSASRFGAIWESYGTELSSTTAPDNDKSVLYYSGTHAARFTRSIFDRVLTSTATSITLKSTDANILLLTPGGSATLTTSGSFPAGYIIEVRNLHASNAVVFARASNYSVSGGTLTRFVCTTSHATTPVFSVLSDDSIETVQIADNAVTTAKILNSNVTLAKIANIADDRILGNVSGGAAAPAELTKANVLTLLNVEDGADATDTANVTAAGALMDSELTDLAGVKGVTISTLQVKPSEGAFANGDKTKLDGIEASADVTDATNVNAAGAIMHSDLGTKGQIVVGDGSGDATILSVGTNNHVLTADSSEASGVKWAATAAAGITALTGNVTASGSGSVAATIADEAVTYAKMQHVSATSRVLGRITSGAGDVEELTGANIRTIANVADGATEYTDAMAQAANAPAITGNTLLANGNVTAIAAINTKAKVRATMSGNLSYSSGTVTLPFDTEVYDIGNDFDTSASANCFEAPRDGYYLFNVNCYFTSAPSWSFTSLYKDTGSGYAIMLRGPSSNGLKELVSSVFKLDAGDKVQARITAASSGTVGNLDTITYFVVQEMV